MNPRKLFPYMPSEVIATWIQPAIEQYGWPFSDSQTSVIGTSWEEIFGSVISLSAWQQFTWTFTELDVHPSVFLEKSIFGLDSIIVNALAFDTPVSSVPKTKEKFFEYLLWAKEHGAIKAPIICLKHHSGQFQIVDGHHRLAAFLHSNPPAGAAIPCWYPEIKLNKGRLSERLYAALQSAHNC